MTPEALIEQWNKEADQLDARAHYRDDPYDDIAHEHRVRAGIFRQHAKDLASALRETAGAISAWWQTKRPGAWTEDEHRANPTINCVGDAEKRLARVAASLPVSPSRERPDEGK